MARSIRHWTPRYVVNRLLVAFYERRNPDAPWLTREANRFLARWLRPEHVGLEWGAGRSTIWLAQRVNRLVSIEHDPTWHARVVALLQSRDIRNVDLHLVPLEQLSSDQSPRYVQLDDAHRFQTFDFILVDGMHRDLCARAALGRLRPNGLLIVDNAERYFPCDTSSPGARRARWTDRSPVWREVAEELSAWRRLWTCDGVSDTALFFKPGQP